MRDTPLRVVQLMIFLIVGSAGVIGTFRWINGIISINESKTIAFLKGLSSAQAQLQAQGAIDQNRDGAGEYAFLGELTGTLGIRGTSQRIGAPILLSSDLKPMGQGIYQRQGYYIRVFLPGADGTPRFEPDPEDSHHPTPIDATLAARYWWAYAWPVEYGSSGNRCFFVSHAGDALSSSNKEGQYSGLDRTPEPNAATAPGSSPPPPWERIIREPARDGMTWHVI